VTVAFSDRVGRATARPVESIAGLGQQLIFHLKALALIPRAVRRYHKEILRLLS
jgi:phospholipid/cholesterol/gamma-HCH transport system permease protein